MIAYILKYKIFWGVVISLICLWGFWLTIDPGYYLTDNNADFFFGSYLHNYYSLRDFGQIALINPYQFLGNVHLGQGQTAVFYLPVYICFALADMFALDLIWAFNFLVLTHLFLAGLGSFFWSHNFRQPLIISWLVALVYTTNAFVFGVSRSWIIVLYAAAYLPWIWLGWENWLLGKSNRRKYFLLRLIALWGLCLQGYIQWIVWQGLFEFLATLWLFKQEKITKPDLYTYLASWVVLAMLAAPVLLPLWHTASLSVARDSRLDLAEILELSVVPQDWLLAQVGIIKDMVLFSGSTYAYHLGIILLAWTGWRIYKSRFALEHEQKFWLGLSLASLVLSTKAYQVIAWLPVINMFRWPFKGLVFFNFFFISLLLAVSSGKSNKRQLGAVLVISLIFNLGLLWQFRSLDHLFSPRQFSRLPQPSWQEIIDPSKGRLFTFSVDTDNRATNFVDLGQYLVPTMLQVPHFSGYDATLSKDLWQTTKGVAAFGSPATSYSMETIQYLRSWSVRYWISSDKQAAEDLVMDYGFTRLLEEEDVTVLEDPQALPFIYKASTKESIDFQWRPDGLDIYPPSTDSLVVSVYAWPEYQVSQDNQAIAFEIIDSQLHLKPTSLAVIRIRFVPISLRESGLIFGLGSLCAFMMIKKTKLWKQ